MPVQVSEKPLQIHQCLRTSKFNCLGASQELPRDMASDQGRIGKDSILIAFKNSARQNDCLGHVRHRLAQIHAGLFHQRIGLLFGQLALFH